MNSFDERLIQLLGKDAQQTSEALAKQLNVSAATVRRRLKRLIENGVIRIMASADAKKLGFPLTAIIAFNVAHDNINSAMQTLSSQPEVKWISTTTGRFDVLAMVLFRSTDELSEFIHTQVAKIDGIRDSETFICLHVKKGKYVAV